MAKRKSDSPQKAALREMMSTYMKENNVLPKNGTDVNSIMRDMMSIILEGTLDAEMDEELGYSKYDYRNKDTENSRNGYSKKTMHTSYGDMDINVPRDRCSGRARRATSNPIPVCRDVVRDILSPLGYQ